MSCSTETSTSTCDDNSNIVNQNFIHYNVCDASCTDSDLSQRDYKRCKKKYNHPDVSTFCTLITPLSNLTPANSKYPGAIQFTQRRKNKVVSLQWIGFSGVMAASGVAYLTVGQTFCNLPPYQIYSTMTIEYNGVTRLTSVRIDPADPTGQMFFYLNTDGTSTGITIGDTVVARGGCVSWIVK